MSVSQKSFNDFMVKLSKEFDLDITKVQELAGDLVKTSSTFTAKAKKFADENDIDISKVSPKGDKVTIEDVRIFMGKGSVSDAFTAKARVLAKENDLTEKDFPVKSRTGKTRKTGVVEITVTDIRKKLGLIPESKSPKASPVALKLAEEHGVEISKVKGTGKDGRVKKEDIENFVKNIMTKDESSDSESSDSEDEN